VVLLRGLRLVFPLSHISCLCTYHRCGRIITKKGSKTPTQTEWRQLGMVNLAQSSDRTFSMTPVPAASPSKSLMEMKYGWLHSVHMKSTRDCSDLVNGTSLASR